MLLRWNSLLFIKEHIRVRTQHLLPSDRRCYAVVAEDPITSLQVVVWWIHESFGGDVVALAGASTVFDY